MSGKAKPCPYGCGARVHFVSSTPERYLNKDGRDEHVCRFMSREHQTDVRDRKRDARKCMTPSCGGDLS